MDWLSWELLRYPGWLLAILLVLVGLIGTVLPAIPGVPILFVGLVLMAWLEGFISVGIGTLIGLGLLALLSVIIDFLATAEGARRFGAGRHAILGATLGLLVGLFFGLPGLLLGPFIGAVLGHLASRANIDSSMRAGVGATLGVLVGTISKLIIALIMLTWFALAWWL
ncbi:MAG: DUF456 family protein [Wenzhouxiangella sp.]|nr:DUF456 family protein [Wenzhouxiangella sp.]MCH8478915.1 DUF456 family protein [Wenzhouxiangella sp.]TVR92474.1 MAG: DUF456 family protein [Wenzhouxiangellaceae bacterium]